MASRTQLRLGQITGSLGDFEGGIVDTLGSNAGSSLSDTRLNSGSLVGVVSEIASSLKRIHGASFFAKNDSSILRAGNKNRIAYLDGEGVRLFSAEGAQGTEVLSVAPAGARVGITGSFFPEANRTRTLGSTTLQFLEIHGDLTGSVNGAVAGTGITNDQVVVSNNGSLEGDSNFTWNGTLLTLGGQSQGTSQLSVSGDATIAGDLTVQGSTVTLNTTNTTITDRLFFLHDGNTVNAGNANGTSAIAFASGSASDDESTIIGTLGNDIIAVARMDAQGGEAAAPDFTNLVSFRAKDIEVNGATNKFEIDSSNLTAVAAASFKVNAANKIVLDTDDGIVEFFDNTTEYGRVQFNSNVGLALSSSAGNDVTLASQTGFVGFLSKDITAGGSNAAINPATANEIFFGHWNPLGGDDTAKKAVPGHFILKNNAVSVLSASVGLQIDAGAANGELQLLSTDGVTANLQALSTGLGLTLKNAASEQNELQFFSGSNYVSLKSPAGLSGNVTLVLPDNDGDPNQVLTTDGSGNLSFATAGAASTSKGTKIVTGAATNTLNFNSVDVGDTISGLQTVDQKLLDVFVNGQLMTTGSVADVETNGNRDYRATSSTQLRFAFDLEADDVVVVIKRG